MQFLLQIFPNGDLIIINFFICLFFTLLSSGEWFLLSHFLTEGAGSHELNGRPIRLIIIRLATFLNSKATPFIWIYDIHFGKPSFCLCRTNSNSTDNIFSFLYTWRNLSLCKVARILQDIFHIVQKFIDADFMMINFTKFPQFFFCAANQGTTTSSIFQELGSRKLIRSWNMSSCSFFFDIKLLQFISLFFMLSVTVSSSFWRGRLTAVIFNKMNILQRICSSYNIDFFS